MGVKSVIATFSLCILFNVILPSGDQGSDMYLLYNVLTFQLGVSLELSGCRSCYTKTESEIYYPKLEIKDTDYCKNLCML